MKRSIFALTAVLLLVLAAAPLVAQSQDQTQDQTQGQTQPYENRTQPNAPSMTEGSGLTITGTVVSATDTSLVLDTTSGQLTIQMNDRTQHPTDLKAGDSVSVDYTRTTQGVMIASQVRPSGAEGTETASTATTTEESTESTAEANTENATEEATEPTSEATAEAMNEPSENTESDLNEDEYSQPSDTDTSESSTAADTTGSMNQDTSGYDSNNLPATGSNLPLLGLLGLLSLAGAAGIRTLTR